MRGGGFKMGSFSSPNRSTPMRRIRSACARAVLHNQSGNVSKRTNDGTGSRQATSRREGQSNESACTGKTGGSPRACADGCRARSADHARSRRHRRGPRPRPGQTQRAGGGTDLHSAPVRKSFLSTDRVRKVCRMRQLNVCWCRLRWRTGAWRLLRSSAGLRRGEGRLPPRAAR